MAEVHTANWAGEEDGGATGGGGMGSTGGIQGGGLQGDKKRKRVQKIGGVWGRNPTGCGNPVDQARNLCSSVRFQRSKE